MDEISEKIAESIRQVLAESGVTNFQVKVKSPNNIECLFVQPAIVENVTFVVSKPEIAHTDDNPVSQILGGVDWFNSAMQSMTKT